LANIQMREDHLGRNATSFWICCWSALPLP